jgi:Phytanoyl-CoA dioxygenase (PhyH)
VNFDFRTDGTEHVEAAFDHTEWLPFFDTLPLSRPGLRLIGLPWLHEIVGTGSVANTLADTRLGAVCRPVRALLFDKSAQNNWPLGWHQDRVIAVKQKHAVEGFGPWTRKAGLHHVQPPFAIIDAMVTLRIHLDDVDEGNAPLRVALGSHRFGRIAESAYDAVVDELDEQICLAKAGDIWIYSTPILHASSKARRPSRRRVVQVDYSACTLPAPLDWLGV